MLRLDDIIFLKRFILAHGAESWMPRFRGPESAEEYMLIQLMVESRAGPECVQSRENGAEPQEG